MKTPRKDTLHSKRRTTVRFDSSPGSHSRSWQTLLEVLRYTTSKKGAENGFGFSQAGSIPSRAPKKKPRKRGQGSPGVAFQPKWRGDARTARREGVHGDAGIRKHIQKMMENYNEKKCIVRCYRAGVFFGEVKEVSSDANGLNVRLANARKVWYWDGAAAVEQLSQEGCNDSSKITVAVPELVVADAVQIIPCSDKAVRNLEAKKEWKR